MDHETAGPVLVPVPPPKVVRAVHGVLQAVSQVRAGVILRHAVLSAREGAGVQKATHEQPLEVDRLDVSDLTGRDELFDLPVRRVVSVVEQNCIP